MVVSLSEQSPPGRSRAAIAYPMIFPILANDHRPDNPGNDLSDCNTGSACRLPVLFLYILTGIFQAGDHQYSIQMCKIHIGYDRTGFCHIVGIHLNIIHVPDQQA